MDSLVKYVNGNYFVEILSDGTKIRSTEEDKFIPDFPESIDVKITNYCDLRCPYCHENSDINGEHANVDTLIEILKDLPQGIELAIGGGNPLSHNYLFKLLEILKGRGFICNITINQKHIKEYISKITYMIKNDLVKGIGISISDPEDVALLELKKLSNNIVYHVIAGVHGIDTLTKLSNHENSKILILGYKRFGRGADFYNDKITDSLKSWYRNLHKFIGKCVLSFDNLAIEQLNVKRLFTEDGWTKFYMGDDFTYTMYIDSVKQEYAPTSRSKDRISFNKMSLLEYFRNNRNQ